MRPEKDHGEARGSSSKDGDGLFSPFFPTETKGDGRLRGNNANSGSAQGQGSFKRKAPCRICGFLVDLNSVDHSGGDLTGDGAGGTITAVTDTGTMLNGGSVSETYGDQAYRSNGGCPLCFSKNSATLANDIKITTDSPRPFVGF